MIVAPFDGVVAEKLALAFTDIAAGAPVFQVDGVRSGTEIIANASTTQAPHIDVGQRAELSWSGAEQPIRAVVRRVGLRAENGSLLPVVLVPEDNAQARALRPGIPVQVVLDAPAATSKTSRPETVSIPYASLVLGTKPGEASVFVYTLKIRRCTVARCASRRYRKETARASSLDSSPARRWLPPEEDGSPMDSQ
ncbi:HlyD family efflux transporter periplasmic adaptor subunit [Achromobacter xylosoxidans]